MVIDDTLLIYYNKNDEIRFVTETDIIYTRQGNDLILEYGECGSITIKDYLFNEKI